MMSVGERALWLLENVEQMTEEELRQECMLCETEFAEQLEDLAMAARIFRFIKDGSCGTLASAQHGLL